MTPPFPDRRAAGRKLAERLAHLAGAQTVVLGLPRGGVPVADEVARHLNAPLVIVLVRKIGMPMNPELALGAIAGPQGQTLVLNTELVEHYGIDPATITTQAAPQRAELARRSALWGAHLHLGTLTGKAVILVDDGIATGATMRAAIAAIRSNASRRIIVATPVAAPDTLNQLSALADEIICLHAPSNFIAVGQHYINFAQVDDAEVRAILAAARSDGLASPVIDGDQ